MIEAWRGLVWQAAAAPTLCVSGVRKIISDLHWSIDWGDLITPDLNFTDICYTSAKLRQLERNYWNVEGFEAAFTKLAARKGKDHTSVSIQLQADEKDSRSQGFCMQNMVITQTKDVLLVDVYYRSTEVLQKFLADLILFSQKLPPMFTALGRNPTQVRFHFANMYLSAVFMPILMRYEPDPVGFFKELQKGDPRFFRTCGLSTRVFFRDSHNYTYRTRVKMFDYWKKHVDPGMVKSLGTFLDKLKGIEPDLPETDDDE